MLIDKLRYYGVTGQELEFLQSYLTGRNHVVEINGQRSSSVPINFGVPQGSVLGPFLFSVMINDLPNNINALSILYADDSTFFYVNKNLEEMKAMTSTILKEISLWFSKNGFLLNKDKTQIITYSLKNLPIENVKLLGLYLNTKLSWKEHIEYVCKKLARVIYLLRSLTNIVTHNYLRQAYFAFFQSVFRYGLLLYGNGTDLTNILKLQKKALRIITFSSSKVSCRPLFVREQIMTVYNVYILELLMYTKQNCEMYSTRRDFHNYDTRSASEVNVPFARLSMTQKSHVVMGMNLLNRLPCQYKNGDLRDFKIKIKNWLLTTPFYSMQECLNYKF